MQNVRNAYLNWLKEKIPVKEIKKIKFKQTNGLIEITTPFLDRHNDWIQIYLRKTKRYNGNDIFILTDNGNTCVDLALAGINLLNHETREIFQAILHEKFNMRLNALSELNILCEKEEELPEKIHLLIEAIITISHLHFYDENNADKLLANRSD